MSNNKVHFLALDGAKSRLAATEEEYKEASKQLNEAIKLGDLSENAEYDTAKAAVARLAAERDNLSAVVTLPVVKSDDNKPTIDEGSVVHIIVNSITKYPLAIDSPEFASAKEGKPVFEGVVMFGATLSTQGLLEDKALSSNTPIGKELIGKQPGDYSIAVPAGFANVTVVKLSSTTKLEELYCKL